MIFSLLPTMTVLIGIAGLALALWIFQRLRVQHREIEVLSTLFWQAAIEETRARVFLRQFRHWLAYMLLVAIASFLWMLLARPISQSKDGIQHVVLVDWSVDDLAVRQADLQLAIKQAEGIPENAREIIAVGSQLETLLTQGEPLEIAEIRAAEDGMDSWQRQPKGFEWAIEALSFRASSEHPLALHLVGDADIDQSLIDSLNSNVTIERIERIERDEVPDEFELTTLGVADARSGSWSAVDVAIGLVTTQPIDPERLGVTVNDQPIAQSLARVNSGEFEYYLFDVPADGGRLQVSIDGESIGSITLPTREPIRILVEDAVPATLRDLIRLDKACQIVDSDADLRVGFSADADLRLTMEDQPAFFIESDQDDPQAALDELINELALQQIDATAIADESGQMIDLQVAASDRRSVAFWGSLLTSGYDFAESRACPIFVARSIRWIANRPPLIPWAQQGDRLPVAAPPFERVSGLVANTSDGRQVESVRLSQPVRNAAVLGASPDANLFSRIGLVSWFGVLVVILLAGEWMLYQRGRMP